MYTLLRKRVTDGIEKVVYPNGLTLTLHPDRRVPVAAARCYVRGGSVSEDAPGGRGIAHLLEHLIATAAAAEMEEHCDGALLNAFTTQDYTCYHWSALQEDVVSSLRQFFAGLRRAASLSCDLEAEKKVVLQEIELFREKKLAVFQQCFLEEMFEVHPLRYPVCGYAALLREVNAADLSSYLNRLYTGANLRLVVAGAFDEPGVVAAVEEACASLPEGRRFELQVVEPPRGNERVFEMETSGLRGGYTQVGLRIAGSDLDDAVAFAALAHSVNNSGACTIRRELVDGGLALDLEARSVASAFQAGYFRLLVHHPTDRGAAVEKAIRRWLEDVATGRPALCLDAVRSAAEREDEPTPDGWAALVGHGEVRSGQPLESWHFQERLRAIEEDQVREAVARHLCGGNLTVGRLRHPREVDSPNLTRPAPDWHEETLPNGVRLLILPTPNSLASCQVLHRGGVLAENEETNGLCSLMARLLPRSIPGELRQDLTAYRDATGADFFGFCDENFFGVSLTVGEQDLVAGLRLLAAMVVRPAFTSQAFEDERRRTAEWVAAPTTSWLSDLQAHLKRLLYRRHPYRLSEIGTPESLMRLNREDMVDCHRRTCVGGNTVVVVTGRVSAEDVRDAIATLFEPVPPGTFFGPSGDADGVAEEPPGTTVLSRPWGLGAMALGYRGIGWEPESWCRLELLKALLAGPENNSVRGRMTRAMREEGAAYSVHCYNQAGFGEGYFAILAAYAPENEERAVSIVTREIERLRSGAMTAGELDHCRKLYLLQHLRRYESPRSHAYDAGRQMLFSTRPASWNMISEVMRPITVNDLASAAQLAFHDRRQGLVLLRPPGDSP